MREKIIYILRRLAGKGSRACQAARGSTSPMDPMLGGGGGGGGVRAVSSVLGRRHFLSLLALRLLSIDELKIYCHTIIKERL